MSLTPTEHMEQVTLLNWFNMSYPKYRGRLVAIPNGAHLAGNSARRSQQMNKLKAEGLAIGFPDLFLPIPLNGFHGLFIEMKRVKKSTTSKEQKEWNEYLNSMGYKATICKGWEEAKEVIECYLNTITPTTKNG